MRQPGSASNPSIGKRWSAEHTVAAITVVCFFGFAFVTGWTVGIAAARAQAY